MSVDNPNVIDAIGVDKVSEEVVLTISDHLEWDHCREHLQTLDRKIKQYFEFIHSGQVHDVYPSDKDRPCRIEIFFKFAPPVAANGFLTEARCTAKLSGIGFAWSAFLADVPSANAAGNYALSLEGEDKCVDPTVTEVFAAIERMTPNGGPGFVILDGPDGSYAQAAGGDGLFTVEWRQCQGDSFRHWVAGKDGDDTTDCQIPTNGCVVNVKKNEQLDLGDVQSLFEAFLAGREKPSDFLWRDITNRFH